jgi:hypothetical protein
LLECHDDCRSNRTSESGIQRERLHAALSHLPYFEFDTSLTRDLWFVSPTAPSLLRLSDVPESYSQSSVIRSANAAVYTLLTRITMLRSTQPEQSSRPLTLPRFILDDLLAVLKVQMVATTGGTVDCNAGLLNLQQGCVECLSQVVSWGASSDEWIHSLTRPRVLVQQVDAEIEPLFGATHPLTHPSNNNNNNNNKQNKRTTIANEKAMTAQEVAIRVIELMGGRGDVIAATTADVLCICACNALIGSLKSLASDGQLNLGAVSSQVSQTKQSPSSTTTAPRLAIVVLCAKVRCFSF